MKIPFTAVIAGTLLAVLLVLGVRYFLTDPAARELRGRFSKPGNIVEAAGLRLNQPALLARMYQDTQFKPIWTEGTALLPRSKAFLKFLRSYQSQGLERGAYHFARIKAMLAEPLPSGASEALKRSIDLELLLADSCAQLGRELRDGAVDPRALFPEWFFFPAHADDHEGILTAMKAQDVERALQALEPTDSGYVRLRQGLERYRQIKQKGGWPVIPDGPKLWGGERDDRILLLRERLLISGDLEPGASGGGGVFDSAMVAALTRFQARHGLLESGILDESTLAELNVRIEKRIRQMALNLERLRWLPRNLKERNIFVNVAACSLELIEKDRVILKKRVIVGSNSQKTVLFTRSVSTMDINPYWEAPQKIIINEMIPRIKINPQLLAAQGIRIIDGYAEPKEIKPEDIDWTTLEPAKFEYRLRQDPGPENPLGCIKFLFPNEFNIYLHDTPERELFESDLRTYSHGCIRLESPLELAELLLKDSPEWNHEEIQRVVQNRVRRTIDVPDPIPICIYYLTAWADREGVVHFCRDVYSVDNELTGALKQARAESKAPDKIQ